MTDRRQQQHYCHEWDELNINNTDIEFENCLCFEEPYPDENRSGQERRGEQQRKRITIPSPNRRSLTERRDG